MDINTRLVEVIASNSSDVIRLAAESISINPAFGIALLNAWVKHHRLSEEERRLAGEFLMDNLAILQEAREGC